MSAPQLPMSREVSLLVKIADEQTALQLAQLIKRIPLTTLREFTEAHLPIEERTERAYQMRAGLTAVATALRAEGFEPR